MALTITGKSQSKPVDEEKVRLYRDIAISKYLEYQYEEAIKKFSYVLRYHKEDHEAYYMRGMSKAKMQEFSSAARDISKAVEIDSTIAEYHFRVGENLYKQQKFEKALKSLNDAILLDQKNPIAFYYRAACNKRLGNSVGTCDDLWQSAELEFEKADKMFKKHCK
jgi:tetratricopeptide (TPR) repeat protein